MDNGIRKSEFDKGSLVGRGLGKIGGSQLKKYKEQLDRFLMRSRKIWSIRDIEDVQIKQQLLRQQLLYDHAKHQTKITSQTQKNLQPHERQSPFRLNYKKAQKQLQQHLKTPNGTLCLSFHKYTPQQIITLLHSLKDVYDQQNQVRLASLYISSARVRDVIRYISCKRFGQLRTINVGGNFVGSLEGLAAVYMPQLENLYVWNNNITELRCLKKCNWPNLKTLDAHQNKLREIENLRYLGNKQLKSLILDSNLLTNFNEGIVACSQSPASQISASGNLVIKWMGRPDKRMRKKAIQIKPCTMKVRYM